MRRSDISQRKLTDHSVRQRERKFEEIIKEIIDDCKAIRQLLHEAEQSLSKVQTQI